MFFSLLILILLQELRLNESFAIPKGLGFLFFSLSLFFFFFFFFFVENCLTHQHYRKYAILDMITKKLLTKESFKAIIQFFYFSLTICLVFENFKSNKKFSVERFCLSKH